jgi:hypothetical protein
LPPTEGEGACARRPRSGEAWRSVGASADLHPEGGPGGRVATGSVTCRVIDGEMRYRDGPGLFPFLGELFSCWVMNSDAEAGIGVRRLAHS